MSFFGGGLNEILGKTLDIAWFEYIGEDGSMGLKKGDHYYLKLTGLPIPDKRINNARILANNFGRWKCPYSTMETFKQNWKRLGEEANK